MEFHFFSGFLQVFNDFFGFLQKTNLFFRVFMNFGQNLQLVLARFVRLAQNRVRIYFNHVLGTPNGEKIKSARGGQV
jgi:hypothetical protein